MPIINTSKFRHQLEETLDPTWNILYLGDGQPVDLASVVISSKPFDERLLNKNSCWGKHCWEQADFSGHLDFILNDSYDFIWVDGLLSWVANPFNLIRQIEHSAPAGYISFNSRKTEHVLGIDYPNQCGYMRSGWLIEKLYDDVKQLELVFTRKTFAVRAFGSIQGIPEERKQILWAENIPCRENVLASPDLIQDAIDFKNIRSKVIT